MSLINGSENIININSPDNSRASLFHQNISPFKKNVLTSKTKQNQAEKREILVKCINRIRQSTQVKPYLQLSERQLNIVDDYGSLYSQNQASKKEITKQETHFESNYYQSKLQAGKLRTIVLQYIEKMNKKQEWSIKPSHPFIIFWNVLKLCFMVHIFILFPLIDAFNSKMSEILQKQNQIFFIEWIFLLFDIVLRFNVQIYKDGQLVKSHYILAQSYLKNGLIVDLLGIVGFSLFYFQDTLYLKYIYFLKISEIKKFIKFLRYEIDPQNIYDNHIKLITLFVTIFFLAHIIACLWIVSGQNKPNWLESHNLLDDEWFIQYLWAFYFAILTMTTVGYGDIVPVNTTELISCILIVLLSSAIFAYTLNTITTVLKDIDQNKSQYQEEARIIQSYMIKKGCDTDLQRRVQQYLKQMWKWGLSEKKQQEQIIFSKLSQHLQQEINLQDKGQMLLKLPFIVNNFNIECIKQLMSSIEEVYYQPGEIINASDGLYLLYKGQVDICWGSKTDPKQICKLGQGDNFGLLNIFNIDKSKYFLKSSNFSIFYFIPTQTMRKILKENDNETFCMINDQVLNENYQNVYLLCKLCNKEGHGICQDIVFKPNKAITIAKYNKNQFQQRRKIRRNLSKFQILKNLKDRQEETCQFIQDKKDVMLLRFKAIIDSEDIDEDQESIEIQSSQSMKFDSDQMDEQISNHPNLCPYLKQQTNSKRPGYTKKHTTLRPQAAMAGFLRKNTQEISINLTTIQPSEPQQEQLVQVTNLDGSTPKSKEKQYNIDIMKSFNRYFTKYNFDNVIRCMNQKKRVKKRLRRYERF